MSQNYSIAIAARRSMQPPAYKRIDGNVGEHLGSGTGLHVCALPVKLRVPRGLYSVTKLMRLVTTGHWQLRLPLEKLNSRQPFIHT